MEKLLHIHNFYLVLVIQLMCVHLVEIVLRIVSIVGTVTHFVYTRKTHNIFNIYFHLSLF